jgi:hypothetical protein
MQAKSIVSIQQDIVWDSAPPHPSILSTLNRCALILPSIKHIPIDRVVMRVSEVSSPLAIHSVLGAECNYVGATRLFTEVSARSMHHVLIVHRSRPTRHLHIY